jgi:hypothetical protein
MDALFPLYPGFEKPVTLRRGLFLAVMLNRETGKVTRLIAGLALRGPLHVVAGSEWVPSYQLARLLRHRLTQIEPVLGRIQLARAFTCYQLLDLLATIRPEPVPVLVLDMLHTFLNTDIHLDVRKRVLEKCGRHLQQLALSRPVAVLTPQVSAEDYPHFYTMLASMADQVYQAEPGQPAASQPVLF